MWILPSVWMQLNESPRPHRRAYITGVLCALGTGVLLVVALQMWIANDFTSDDPKNRTSIFRNRVPPGYEVAVPLPKKLMDERRKADVCCFVPSPASWRQRRQYVSMDMYTLSI